MLSRGTYEAIVANLADKKTHERQSESLRSVAFKFPNVPHDTLYSIHAQQIQQATKQHYSYHKKPPVTRSYYERYLASSDDPEILLQISNDISLSPALLSRLILESYIAEHSIAAARSPSTAIVSQWMKEPQLIPNKQLQQQVVTCILNDANYGLLAENIKSSVGYQYEQKLRRILEERKIPFLDEEFMRSHGYDKTPDFKIHVPFAVGGTVVNWIESKALFANEASHKRYCEEQLLSYYNRLPKPVTSELQVLLLSMANDAYLKPGPLFPALPYSYYSSQHSAPGCCDSLPSLPGRYNPYTIPSTFPGTPRRPTPMSDLFSFNDIRSLQPPVPRTGIMDNAHHLTGVGNSESSPISATYFDKTSSSSQFVPTISSTVCPPFGSACGSFNRVEDLAGMPGTGTSTSLLTGHNSYSPAPQDSAVNADTTSTTPLPSLVNSTSTTTTNTYPWSFYYQGLQMTTPNTKVFSGAPHQSYSFDSPKVKLTSEVAVPLIEWFEEHRDHPYPSRQDKVTLCQMTGLTFTQVSTWFANARRRMKKHSLHDSTEMSLSPSEIANEEKSKSRRLSSSEECEVLSPE